MGVELDLLHQYSSISYNSFKQKTSKHIISLKHSIDKNNQESVLSIEEEYRKLYFELLKKSGVSKKVFDLYLFGNYSTKFEMDDNGILDSMIDIGIFGDPTKNTFKYRNQQLLNISIQEIQDLRELYSKYLDKSVDLIEELIDLGLESRETELGNFSTVITTRNSQEELTGYFRLNRDQLKGLLKNMLVSQMEIRGTEDIQQHGTLTSRKGLSDIRLIDTITTLFQNEVVNQYKDYQEIYAEMRKQGIRNLEDTANIKNSRLAEALANPIIVDIFQKHPEYISKILYYQDTESFITGNDVETPIRKSEQNNIPYGLEERSSKSLKSGSGFGYDIADLASAFSAVELIIALYDGNEENYNQTIANKGFTEDSFKKETTINGIPISKFGGIDEATGEIFINECNEGEINIGSFTSRV